MSEPVKISEAERRRIFNRMVPERNHEPFKISEEERRRILNKEKKFSHGEPFKISEAERRRVLDKVTPVRSRVRINNTGSGRWNVKVDGKTVILANDHMEASAMKRALQSYIEVLDADS